MVGKEEKKNDKSERVNDSEGNYIRRVVYKSGM